jgi:7-keto-8-aminopelargonate synthetase-like enzyme
MPPANVATVIATLEIMQNEPERIQKLWDNTHFAIKSFKEAGFDIGKAESPIIPIYIRDDLKTFKFTKLVLDEGVFVNPVCSPAVNKDSSLVRFSLMATHSYKQIETAVNKMVKVAKQLEII